MKKIILSIAVALLAFAITSCKDKKASDIKKMTASINKFIDDGLFKENITTTLKEVKFLSIDTLNENTLDTLRLLKNQEKIEGFLNNAKQYHALIKNEISQMELQRSLGWTSMLNTTKRDYEEHKEKAKELLDSVSKYEMVNEKIQTKIKANKMPKAIYEMKMFLKLTMKKGNESHNMLDTAYYHFNQALERINN